MLFSDTERRELAAFFAKRFSDPTVRAMLAKRAGVKEDADEDAPGEAWDSLILQAQRRRKLSRLALVASKMDQTDQNLQAVCNLLGARARTLRNRAIAGGLAATIALGFGVGGWMLGTDEAPDLATDTLAQPALTLASVPALTFPELTAPPAPALDLTAKETRRLDREQSRVSRTASKQATRLARKKAKEQARLERDRIKEEARLARAEERKNRPPSGPAWRNGRCTYDKPGQFIGYWYAGTESPGHVGEVINVPISVNVREDHPSAKNGYFKKASVRCLLRRGDKVKLTGTPIEVSRGHFWVPLYHGDLVAESTENIATL